MKYLKYIIIFVGIFLTYLSCQNDDDICESGLGTPMLKIKFKDKNGKLIQHLDSVASVSVDMGNGRIAQAAGNLAEVDSLLVPLRLDENSFTDIYFKRYREGDSSKIRISYSIESQYVSPACGFRRLYKNLSAKLLKALPVSNVELNQNEISDDNKTHIYLVF